MDMDERLEQIEAAYKRFGDDMAIIAANILEQLQPLLDTMNQIVEQSEIDNARTNKGHVPDRINDPRLRRKKGRNTWR